MGASSHEQLAALLDEHSLVTYRYYAQHADVSVTDAKEALRAYHEANAGSGLTAIYMVGGSRAGGNGGMGYELVPYDALDLAKERYESPSCHLYSLGAPKALSNDAIFLLNHGQDRRLYEEVRARPLSRLWGAWGDGHALCRAHARCPPPPPPPPPPTPRPPFPPPALTRPLDARTRRS